VAQSFANEGLLAASFFFKRGERDRGNASRFFCTIAAQLVVRMPMLSSFISEAIEADPSLTGKSMKEQFEKLILQPLSKARLPPEMSTRTIVIDALDECEREGDIKNILYLLAQVQHITSVRVRVLITSRPELPVRLGFKKISGTAYQDLILQEIPQRIIEHDIAAFLKCELEKIRDDHNSLHPGRPLSSVWPSEKNIQALVKMAVPLFIFAATVCRFVEDSRWDPEEQLQSILSYQTASQVSKLDRTYLPILDRLLHGLSESQSESLTEEFRIVVGSIALLANPLSAVSLASLIGVRDQIVECRLRDLHSVLNVPADRNIPVRLLHLSFREFLTDPEKRGRSPFWVDSRKTHEMIATRCLELMSHSLKENACKLESPGTFRAEIDSQIIKDTLPAHLQYACCYWVNHLEQSGIQISDHSEVHFFLLEHLLHWLEALALIGRLAESVGTIVTLKALMNVSCR
jgi:hypothetical protein